MMTAHICKVIHAHIHVYIRSIYRKIDRYTNIMSRIYLKTFENKEMMYELNKTRISIYFKGR